MVLNISACHVLQKGPYRGRTVRNCMSPTLQAAVVCSRVREVANICSRLSDVVEMQLLHAFTICIQQHVDNGRGALVASRCRPSGLISSGFWDCLSQACLLAHWTHVAMPTFDIVHFVTLPNRLMVCTLDPPCTLFYLEMMGMHGYEDVCSTSTVP